MAKKGEEKRTCQERILPARGIIKRNNGKPEESEKGSDARRSEECSERDWKSIAQAPKRQQRRWAIIAILAATSREVTIMVKLTQYTTSGG